MKSTVSKVTDKKGNNYVIGIGASAGGLDAINELFDNMPVTTGYSFVIIQHLSPHHKSLMAELLSKHTEMQVLEAEEGMELEANSIYLIPPGKIITLKKNKLSLEEKIRDHQPNTAIDIFFESLARDKQDKAVGVILSGSGTDGTRGIQAIHEHGGIVIVQDPSTAQFDGMPNSAINSGYADMILSPDTIAEELTEYIRESPLIRSFNALNNQEEGIRQDILELVFKTTGHDFSAYKRPTINRRLARRMAEKNIKTLSDYYNYLLSYQDEVKRLCKEFLLHVTKFFRDEEAFASLRVNVLPRIFARKDNDEVIKVWTVACSTGEEAYSLAMLFDEYQEEHKQYNREVKIFATDISQEVIEIASRGIYTEEQVRPISRQRLKRYFVKEGGHYKVAPSLRKMIVFAKHDIIKDPPFSKIDLLTCRNMMIYMSPALQNTVLQKFHFALCDNAYLMLGSSENIGILKEVMQEVDRKWKLFNCISKVKVAEPEPYTNPPHRSLGSRPVARTKNALNSLSEIFKETLLEEYDYAGILIDKEFEVKQAMGNFRKFMDLPEDSFNLNLLKLVPKDLGVVLSTMLRKAIRDNERVVQKHIKVRDTNNDRSITVVIKPFITLKTYSQSFLFVILKEEEPEKARIIPVTLSEGEYATERIHELETELHETKENLQALIEEVESANEELQSSNEEIITSNEELQSTNEELQSLNEELHTVNAEHQVKIKELIELNDDLNNYFRNTEIGQVLVDRDLLIRRFTPAVTAQVNLKPNDVGRSIVDISVNIKGIDFLNDIRHVIQSNEVVEREVSMKDDKAYMMRIAPYLRQNKVVDGAVINFIDVTEITKLNKLLGAVFNSSTSGIMALKAIRNDNREITDFEIISANKASMQLASLPESAVGNTYMQLYGDVNPNIFDRYVHVTETGLTASFEHYNAETNKWYDIVGVKMMDGLVVTFTDITGRKQASETISRNYMQLQEVLDKLRDTNHKLEQSNLDLLQFASVASHDLKEPLRKVQAFGNLLQERTKDKLEEKEMYYVDKIVKTAYRMQALIDDILTLSRLSNTGAPKKVVNLNDLVGQIVEDLEISIKEKHAAVNIKPLPKIRGVQGQLHQLFQNLISNAIKFNEGKPVVEIGDNAMTPELEKEFGISAKDYDAMYVQDNGIGFDPQFSDRIFGIFQRLEKANYQGTGIGLAIAKKIIDNHNGFIKASSAPGKGTRFTIILPRDGEEE